MIHELKCWPEYYQALIDGRKTFEVRQNDRNYAEGDKLLLCEWDPGTQQYTGRQETCTITYVLSGQSWVVEGYAVLGVRLSRQIERLRREEGGPVSNDELGQTCKVCGRRDKFDFDVPDEIWQAVVPPEYQQRVVCLSCFDDMARNTGVAYATSLPTLYFAGDKASFRFEVVSATDLAAKEEGEA